MLTVRGQHDLCVAPGEIVGLEGPSGSGKSRLLRRIADLDPGDDRVELDGRSREQMPAPAWRRAVTYVAAEAAFWADTVDEHFEGEGWRELFARLGLALPPRCPVARLSSGERARVGLVRAWVQSPRILLLDEPTASLDPTNVERVERLLVESDAGILIVSHDAAQLERIADRCLHLSAEGALS